MILLLFDYYLSCGHKLFVSFISFFSSTIPLCAVSPWGYILDPFLITSHAVFWGDFVQVLASVTTKKLYQNLCHHTLPSHLHITVLGSLRFYISQAEHTLYSSFLTSLPTLHCYSRLSLVKHYHPPGLFSQKLRPTITLPASSLATFNPLQSSSSFPSYTALSSALLDSFLLQLILYFTCSSHPHTRCTSPTSHPNVPKHLLEGGAHPGAECWSWFCHLLAM